MEKNLNAIESVYNAIMDFDKTIRELEDVGINITAFDDTIEHLNNALEALLPESYGLFGDHIDSFTFEEILMMDERAEEISSVFYSYEGATIKFKNGKTLLIPRRDEEQA
ncbi:hypothetical protein F7731_23765 [Cytobacillus depressus]|uniref:Uncharacterized protein n=1 Tax=Cytobacillus depressus TaxID=1602942 RepID=A0A6L3UY98_9BACI|nr:hypothetical protein [Cytobacillus depressus]KAB2328970.1 hypothetical protein F7731_23765 [Cytobacillus depressus]